MADKSLNGDRAAFNAMPAALAASMEYAIDATQREHPVLRRDASALQPVQGACCQERRRMFWNMKSSSSWTGAHCGARSTTCWRASCRPKAWMMIPPAAVRRHRSARRSRPRHRRVQGRQRNRRRHEGRPPLLFRRLPARSGARPDDRGYRAKPKAASSKRCSELHPEADGKPCVIGNCQAGWSLMMLAAVRPELFGPMIVAGSPLSYWGGVRGKYPMRYSGGLLGGSWLTALTSDLATASSTAPGWCRISKTRTRRTRCGPSSTISTPRSTPKRALPRFERWWGGHVNLNAEEIQFIVDELFVGNKLAAGRIRMSDGTAVDLRNIRSPIVVFCSKGDNITPPQQALGWLLDLYDDIAEIRAFGQTIVYTVHETVGHLGIFVSAGVARKEHGEFSSNIDLIDTLPPGLYEAVFEQAADSTQPADLPGANGSCGAKRARLTTSAPWAAMMRPTNAGSPRRRASPRSICRSTARFMQPWVKAFVDAAHGRMASCHASPAPAV